MTGNRYLIDTNIISALFKGEAAIAEKMDATSVVYIPAPAVGEIYFGIALSGNKTKYINDLENLIANYLVVPVQTETCMFYGSIKAELRRKGKPIPKNDIWIAALVSQHHLIVATRDHHFDEIDELPKERW